MKKLSYLILGLVLTTTAIASHIKGSQIYWDALGNNQYIFHTDVLGDFTSTFPAATITLSVNGTSTIQLSLDSGYAVTSCNTNYWSVHRYSSAPVTINAPTSGSLVFSWSTCCFSGTANISGQPSMYVTSTMYPAGANRSSVRYDFTSMFSQDASKMYLPLINPSNDSTHLQLVAGRSNANTPYTYVQGYSAQNPVSAGDALNGFVFTAGSAPAAGIYHIGVDGQQFDMGNQMMATVHLTTLLESPQSTGASNTPPTIGFSNSGLNWSTTDSVMYSIHINPGDTVSASVQSYDFDFLPSFNPQTITASLLKPTVSNTANLIPVAPQSGMSSASTNNVDFLWATPTSLAAGRYVFFVQMIDDHCPLSGRNMVGLEVIVGQSAISQATYLSCAGGSIPLAAPVSGNTYSWTPATGLSSTTSSNPIASPTSTTTYFVAVDGVTRGMYTIQVGQNTKPVVSQPQANQIELMNPGDYDNHGFLYYYVPFAINDTLVNITQSGLYHVVGQDAGCFSLSDSVVVLPDSTAGVYMISSPIDENDWITLDDQSSYEMEVYAGTGHGPVITQILIPGAQLSQKMGSVRLRITDQANSVVETVQGYDAGVGVAFDLTQTHAYFQATTLELLVDSGAIDVPMLMDQAMPYQHQYAYVSSVQGMADGQALTDDIIPFVFMGYNSIGQEEFDASNLLLYPQPADDFIHIDGADFTDYQLIDLNGRVLRAGSMDDNRVDVRNLHTGIYILELSNSETTYLSKISVR